MADAIRIALVGRHTIVREALQRILASAFNITYSGSLSDIKDFGVDETVNIVLLIAEEWDDDTLLLIRAHFPGARNVLLSADFDFQKLRSAFEHGVAGYVVKQIPSERLVGSLRLVAMGEKVFPTELAEELAGHASELHEHSALTLNSAHLSAREFEVLQCLHAGASNKLISRRLGISEATVKVHVKAVLRKLNVANRTQAAIWAVTHDLTEPEGGDAGQQLTAGSQMQ